MQISMPKANATIGSLDLDYKGILLKGIYMRNKPSSAITTDYLFKVMTNKVLRIQNQMWRLGKFINNQNFIIALNNLALLIFLNNWPTFIYAISILQHLPRTTFNKQSQEITEDFKSRMKQFFMMNAACIDSIGPAFQFTSFTETAQKQNKKQLTSLLQNNVMLIVVINLQKKI